MRAGWLLAHVLEHLCRAPAKICCGKILCWPLGEAATTQLWAPCLPADTSVVGLAPRGRGPITSQPLIPTGRGGHTSPPSTIALTSVLVCGPPIPLRSWESAHQSPCGATVRREWPSSPERAQFLGVLCVQGSRPPPQAHCSALPSVLPALAGWTSGQAPVQVAGFMGSIGGQAQVSGERAKT